MEKKTTISLTSILIIGLLVYLLLRSQNTNAATTTPNASDENPDNQQNNTDTNTLNYSYTSEEKDPAINSAIETGTRIGNHSWPTTKSETEDARQGWKEAILFWDDYANANTSNKKKMKARVGYVILACIQQGSKKETFNQRYKHLTDSSTYEYKNIWKELTDQQQNSLKKMNSFAISDEYTRWYQQQD